jgi:hypothetical protein
MCLRGAIQKVVYTDALNEQAFEQSRAAQAALTRYLADSGLLAAYTIQDADVVIDPVAWVNDHVLTDRQQALDLLEKAAVAAEERVTP